MEKAELLSIIGELIVNNSNIGADADDEVMFDGLEDVMTNVLPDGGDVTLLFQNGTKNVIMVE